ncbi:hypothetical protein CPB86DRAFT_692347 [Serendipita vermifera]|nr:hypothetical protein CPB86DRAFT_692347 [Serendipita vermifera]
MTPLLAKHHESNAYHLSNIKVPHYRLKQFMDEEDMAWEGPSQVDDTFAWLKEQEARAYHEHKEKEFLKQNPGWNDYDPQQDEFLLNPPRLSKSGWPAKRNVQRKGDRGYPPRNSSNRPIPARDQNKKKGRQENDDLDSVRVMRKGAGMFASEPFPLPQYDFKPWLQGLKAVDKRQHWTPKIDWNEKFDWTTDDPNNKPLGPKTTAALLQFGKEYATSHSYHGKKKEAMHLFLELPTAEKVQRIETLALKLCDPSLRGRVVDQMKYWEDPSN